MSSADTVSHLLNAPKEIRLMIYRLLLFPQNLIAMGQVDSEADQWSDVDSDEESENDIIDIDFDPNSPHISAQDGISVSMTSNNSSSQTDASMSMPYFEEFPYTPQDYANARRYPAILRTNRQIYEEASSLMYTEATLVIQAEDIFDLASRPEDLEFGVPGEETWRYHPLKDPGKVSTTGEVIYSTSPNLEGFMLPHVFARFQKLYFDACFESEHTENIELWIDDDTHIIRKEDVDNYKSILRNSTFMKDFVKLISRSPLITKLDIDLEVEVMASSNLMTMDTDDEDDEDAIDEKMDDLEDVANEKATEMFLDSGICEPLLTLKNVLTFNMKFNFDREDDRPYKPLPEHVKVLEDMKKTIEANFEGEGFIA